MLSSFPQHLGNLLLSTVQRRLGDDVSETMTSSITMTSEEGSAAATSPTTTVADSKTVSVNANADVDDSLLWKELLQVFPEEGSAQKMIRDNGCREVSGPYNNQTNDVCDSLQNMDEDSPVFLLSGNTIEKQHKDKDILLRPVLASTERFETEKLCSGKVLSNSSDSLVGRLDSARRHCRSVRVDIASLSARCDTLISDLDDIKYHMASNAHRKNSLAKTTVTSSHDVLETPSRRGRALSVDVISSRLSFGNLATLALESVIVSPRVLWRREKGRHGRMTSLSILDRLDDELCLRLDNLTSLLTSNSDCVDEDYGAGTADSSQQHLGGAIKEPLFEKSHLPDTPPLKCSTSCLEENQSGVLVETPRQEKGGKVSVSLDTQIMTQLQSDVSSSSCSLAEQWSTQSNTPSSSPEGQSSIKSSTPSRLPEDQSSVDLTTPDNPVDVYSFLDWNTPAIHALTCLESFTDSGRVNPTCPIADFWSLQSSVMIHTPPSSDASSGLDSNENHTESYGGFPLLSLSASESDPSSLFVSLSLTELEASPRGLRLLSSSAWESGSPVVDLQLLSLVDQQLDVSSAGMNLNPWRHVGPESPACLRDGKMELSVDDSLCPKDNDSEFDWKEYYLESFWDLPSASMIVPEGKEMTEDCLDGGKTRSPDKTNTEDEEVEEKRLTQGEVVNARESVSVSGLGSDHYDLDDNNNDVNNICVNNYLLRTEKSLNDGDDSDNKADNNTVVDDNNNNNNNNVISDCSDDSINPLNTVPYCLTQEEPAVLIVSPPPTSTTLPERRRQRLHVFYHQQNDGSFILIKEKLATVVKATHQVKTLDKPYLDVIRQRKMITKTMNEAFSIGHGRYTNPQDSAIPEDVSAESTPQRKKRRRSVHHWQHLDITPCKAPQDSPSLTQHNEGRRNGNSRLPVIKTKRPKVQSYNTLEDRSCSLNFLRTGNSPHPQALQTSSSLLAKKLNSTKRAVRDSEPAVTNKAGEKSRVMKLKRTSCKAADSSSDSPSRRRLTTRHQGSHQQGPISGHHHRNCALTASRAQCQSVSDTHTGSRKPRLTMDDLKARIREASLSKPTTACTNNDGVRCWSAESVSVVPINAAKRHKKDNSKSVTRSKTSPRKQTSPLTKRQTSRVKNSTEAERTYDVFESSDKRALALSCIVEEATRELEAENSSSVASKTGKSLLRQGEHNDDQVEVEVVVWSPKKHSSEVGRRKSPPETEPVMPVVTETDSAVAAVATTGNTTSMKERSTVKPQSLVALPQTSVSRQEEIPMSVVQQKPSCVSVRNMISQAEETVARSSEAVSKETLANVRRVSSQIAEKDKEVRESSVQLSFKNNFDVRSTSTPVVAGRKCFVLTSTPMTPCQRVTQPATNLFLRDVTRYNMFANLSSNFEDSVTDNVHRNSVTDNVHRNSVTHNVHRNSSTTEPESKTTPQVATKDRYAGCEGWETYVKTASCVKIPSEMAEKPASDLEVGSERAGKTYLVDASQRVAGEESVGSRCNGFPRDEVQSNLLAAFEESLTPVLVKSLAVPELRRDLQSIAHTPERGSARYKFVC